MWKKSLSGGVLPQLRGLGFFLQIPFSNKGAALDGLKVHGMGQLCTTLQRVPKGQLPHFGYFRNDQPHPITLFPLYPVPNSQSFPNPFSLVVK